MPDRSTADLQWGLSVFDDLVHACGALSFKYAECFLARMLEAITHADATVRQVRTARTLFAGAIHRRSRMLSLLLAGIVQAATFGVGIMARHGGSNYVPYIKEALPRLLSVIQDPACREYVEAMVQWADGRTDGRMDGWMDGWMGGWMDGWMDG